MKKFNINGICYPEKHYMTDIRLRLKKIRAMVDEGEYIVINRARQYGKTTTLWALKDTLKDDYLAVFISFQWLSEMDYRDEYAFVSAFADLFTDAFPGDGENPSMKEALALLHNAAEGIGERPGLRRLFKIIRELCSCAPKAIVLLIDEVDSATNNQVFLDFLAQLRAYYLHGDKGKAFWSVVLVGVYDIKNLKLKIRPDLEHQYNSPWNIAVDFNEDMSLQPGEIAEMLEEYERDCHTGMAVSSIAGLLYEYTSGYPFLVSRLCKILDEDIAGREGFPGKSAVWTKAGVTEAVKDLLVESNTLFDDIIKKVNDFPELGKMLYAILFHGDRISYNIDNHVIRIGHMLGLIENRGGVAAITNRIFETRLYNLYLSEEIVNSAIYKAADGDKSLFVKNGQLDMELLLERFVDAFTEIYSDADETFLEENGRRFFLLYLKPIINGTGNYYIEARTRNMRRTDVIIDYHGKQYVCEMKIWRGEEYNKRGEQQLLGYLEDYHLSTGYMLSFNFNKNKKTGIKKIHIGGRIIIEAVV